MGHVRLGVLPASQKWRQVIEHLRLGADADLIVAAVANAAEGSLKRASYDPAFLHSFWLLTQIPLAARSSAFAEDLRRLRVQRLRRFNALLGGLRVALPSAFLPVSTSFA